jgi:hypothetical protein
MMGVSASPVRMQRMTLDDARSQREALGKAAKKKARKRRRLATEIGDVAAGDDDLGDEVVEQRRQARENKAGGKAGGFAWPYALDEPLDDDSGDEDEEEDGVADAFYAAAEAGAKAKKVAKARVPEEVTAWESNTEDNRAITYAMQKNKGLTPSRRKEMRNPRVRHRNKFVKATKRRKGAVVEMRTQEKQYTGEAFGIRTDITKSTKLK